MTNGFVAKVPDTVKTVQMVPVTFQSKDQKVASGTVSTNIRIETDFAAMPVVEAAVSVQLVPSQPGKPLAHD